MRAHGLNNACADGTAINQLRHDNTELFADVLIDEIRLCVGETEPPGASAACHACGSTSHRPGRYLCPQPCNQAHPRCLACGAALRQCYWSNARTTIELLTAHAPTIMAAFHDASRGRRPPGNCQACDRGQPPCHDHAASRPVPAHRRSDTATT